MSEMDWSGLEWKEGVAMPRAKDIFGCAEVGGKIYCIGADTDFDVKRNLVYMFDTRTGAWSEGAHYPEEPPLGENFGCAAHKGKIYCIGGSSSPYAPVVSRVAIYDTATDTWSRGRDMPEEKHGFGCALLDGKIYCMGGDHPDRRNLTSLYVYDVEADSWSEETPLPSGMYNPYGAAAWGTSLYLFGGLKMTSGPLDSVWIYDTVKREWSAGKSMQKEKSRVSATAVGEWIFCLGGSSSRENATYDHCDIYHPATDSWSAGPSLRDAREGSRGVYVNGKLYCLGGAIPGQSWSASVEVLDLGEVLGDHPITQRYETESGRELRAPTRHFARDGEAYRSAAPALEGYVCVGHRIDGGSVQSGDTAVIPAAEGAHEILFLYRKTEEGGGSGGCGCCTKVEIKVTACAGNHRLIDGIAALLREEECGCGHEPACRP